MIITTNTSILLNNDFPYLFASYFFPFFFLLYYSSFGSYTPPNFWSFFSSPSTTPPFSILFHSLSSYIFSSRLLQTSITPRITFFHLHPLSSVSITFLLVLLILLPFIFLIFFFLWLVFDILVFISFISFSSSFVLFPF